MKYHLGSFEGQRRRYQIFKKYQMADVQPVDWVEYSYRLK